MKRRTLVLAVFLAIATAVAPLAAQEKLYPIRQGTDIRVLVNADRTAFAVDRAFQLKLSVGFPEDDKVAFIPKTRTPLILLWLRIQNVSQRPLDIDITKFTVTDDKDVKYAALSLDAAAKRILDGSGGGLGSKTLRSISLGRAGNVPPEEQMKEDIQRYSMLSGSLAAGAVREGFIYFDAPARKKFTASLVLGDLWSSALAFSTEKQR